MTRPRADSDRPEDRGGRGPPARSTVMLRLSSGSSTTSLLLLIRLDPRVSFDCLTSTEARRPVRDEDEWGKGGQKSETSRQSPTRKTVQGCHGPPPEEQDVKLRQCPSGIAQRPPHHAIAVPTAMQNRVTKTMSVAPPMRNN